MEQTVKRRSSIKIMASMIGLVKPLAHIMAAAVILGTLGYLCAIFLTITAGYALKAVLDGQEVTGFFKILVILAVARGILHYAEQYCNHFIAFKLLAIIRHQIFAALRKLCPAKLDGREKGNLITGSFLCPHDLTDHDRYFNFFDHGGVYRTFSCVCRNFCSMCLYHCRCSHSFI